MHLETITAEPLRLERVLLELPTIEAGALVPRAVERRVRDPVSVDTRIRDGHVRR